MALTDMPASDLVAYAPDVQEPADFDEFWSRTLSEARGLAGETVIGEADPRLTRVTVRDVTFSGFGGHPIKAWYARPADAEGDLPCIVQIAGYGGGRGLALEHTVWPSAGYAQLFIDTRGQGSTWGNGGDTPDPVGSDAALPGSMTRGIASPETYYYRRVFTDAVLAVDVARALPGVDASRVGFTGASQGGGVTLAVAGLVPDLTFVMPDVPFLCHFRRAVDIAIEPPFTEVGQYLSIHRDVTDTVFNTLSYFDGVNFAKRAKAPSLWSVALMDPVCPPSTIYAAYNRYGERAGGAPKAIEVYPFNGHEGGAQHQLVKQIEFVKQVLA